MKRLLSLILVAATLTLSFVTGFEGLTLKSDAALNFKCGDNATWYLDENDVLTISGTGDMYDFRASSYSIEGYAPWNDFKYSIKKVVIEEGITSIGYGSFIYCENVTELHIASTVEEIRGGFPGSYGNNNSLRTITVGENSMLRSVSSTAFTYSPWFESHPDDQPVYLGRMLYKFKKGYHPSGTDISFSVSVKEGTIAISDEAFRGTRVSEITFPDSLVYVGRFAFTGSYWLENHPAGAVYAGNVFVGYSGSIPVTESEFTIKEGTTCIAARAFEDSDRIISVNIPSSVKYICGYAFNGCKNLQEVNFSENSQLTHVDDYAFYECSKLSALTLPESTERIGAYALGYTALTEIHFPKNLKKVGILLSYFSSLKKITIDEDNPYLFVDQNSVVYTGDKKDLIVSLREAKLNEYTVQSQCKRILEGAFQYSYLKKINFNQGLEYIGVEAFENSELESISIPKTVKDFGLRAFYFCTENRYLKLEDGLTVIGDQTFSRNSALTEVIIPDSVKSIGDDAFDRCSQLAKITIPAHTTIGYDAFEFCSNLTIYCYRNSPAHTYATDNSIPYVLINNLKLLDVIERAGELDRTLYTDDSLAKLDAAVSAVNLDAENLTQETIDSWYEAIVKAFDELEYRYFYKPTFYVPEVIYMNNKGTVGQYYYGVNTNGAVTQNTPLSTAASGALVYWNLPGATSIRITCELSSNAFAGNTNSGYAVPSSTSTTTSGITAMTIGDVTRADTAIASTGWMGTSSYSANMTALTISSAIAANTYRFLKWTATYICNNQTYTQHAYTILFNNHQSYNVWCECTNKNSVHSDAYSKIRLNINGVTMGENASGSDSDSSSYTVIGSAQLIYDSTRFSNSSYYPNFTAWYEEASWLEKGSGYVGNFSPMIIGTSATQIEAVLGGSFYIQTTCYSEYKDSQADSTALFSVQTKGINKSNLRSNYWSWIKNQRSEGYDTTQYDTYQLTLLQAAAALAVPGSTDTSATLPDDSGFNPDNNNIEDSNLKDAINRAEAIDRTLYTDDSLSKLDAAVSAVNLDADDLTQEMVNAWCEAIEKALSDLVYKNADYTRINTLKETADKLDRSLYTTDSLSELDDAFFAVEYNLSVDKQSQVDLWAEAIEDALQNLEYLPADYSAVEEALETAQKIDRRYYSQISLIRLDNAVNAVDYSLNISEQERVNSFAKAITDALNALEYASVVLRHEECGVIVSATAKEIKPETLLAVEEVDPSNYEGTNFAVGGSIRSLHFYDINLLYNAVIVQPDGTVTVKIRLKDGVDPNKCKVYHVTEDIVNPLVRFANTIDGNYIVFETDHFSEFAVIEVETVVDRIEISSLPIKTEYGIGEVLDLSGMKVTAYYSNGTDKVTDDYNVGLVTLDSIGTKVVTVYYTFGNITKTAEFTVTVTVEKSTVDILENDSSVSFVHKKLGFFSLYTKASIQLGINLDLPDEFTVRWSSDNKKVLVDENGKVTCKGLIGAKKANITVEILDKDGKVISSDTVSVIFYKLSIQLSMLVSKAVDIYKKSIVQY